jgi:hypothetical protein
MTAKRKITDKNGVQVFPITHTKAVLDDNGNSVEQRLQENLDLINQKQLEVGAVPSDVVPTEGSTNWVTSGGVSNVIFSGGIYDFNLLQNTKGTLSNGTINTQNNTWYVNGDFYGYWYDVSKFRGRKLCIITNSQYPNAIAFTTSIVTQNRQPIPYASGTVAKTLEPNSEKCFIIPDDCIYVFVVIHGNETDRYPQALSVKNIVEPIYNDLEYKVDVTEFKSGFFFGTGGNKLASENWSSSRLFNVKNVNTISVSSAINSNALQLVFFDEAGKIMLSDSVVGRGDASYAVSSCSNVPDGAKYALASGYTATSIPIKVTLFSDVSLKLNDIECELGNINRKNEGAIIEVEAVNNGFYNSNGVYTETERWKSTNFINVDGATKLSVESVCTSGAYQIVFFDEYGGLLPESRLGIGSEAVVRKQECAIPSSAKFVVMTGFVANGDKVNAILYYQSSDIEESPLKNTKKITFIVIYGQSLSVGADGTPPISITPEYDNCLMFNTGVLSRRQASAMTSLVPIIESGTETPASGTAEMFVEAVQNENAYGSYKDNWLNHEFVMVCPGVGGATIDELTGTSYYQYVENAIAAIKNICDANGYSLEIPAWCWVQGEQDTKNSMSATDYKNKLLALHNKFCSSVSAITGITERPKCIIYQPSCQNIYDPTAQYNYAYDHMGVPTAFMELLRDNSEFIASSPTYIFDPSNSGGVWVHLNPESYKLLGAYQGYALKRLIIDGERNQGVVPLNITVDGNKIKIKYNVPCPPLRFDTDYVNAAPNMGFNVINSDNTELISSVSVFNDTVTIVCSSSPLGAKLRYGMNGTYHEFISGSYHYYSGAGRVIGARGNLRDNQGCYVYKNIQGVKYPMYNWAYTFEKLLEE